MGYKINISGLDIGGNANLLNRVTINDDDNLDINVQDIKTKGNITMLDDLQINSILAELRTQSSFMDKDSAEYEKIQEIINKDQWESKSFSERIIDHIGNFATGVLANVVSGFLVK